MGKQFLTTLLVLLLVSPQADLAAKGRHNHSHGNHHKYMGFPHATKSQLKWLKQAVSDINARIDALQDGDLPPDLAATLGDLKTAVDSNSSDLSMALDEIIDIMSAIDSIIARISALEESGSEPPDAQKLIYSGHFINRNTPATGSQLVEDWVQFREDAGVINSDGSPPSYSSIEIRGSVGVGVSCSDPDTATAIANALSNGGPGEFNCENRWWNVGTVGIGGIELNAGSFQGVTGNCLQEASVRPLIGSSNWGGIGFTCVAPSQTLEVILTPTAASTIP